MVKLAEPLTVRSLEIPNRVWLPPMCQYQAVDGTPNDWHLVHYGARAVGGFGLIIAEATGVVPEGRISPACTGLWSDEHVAAWRKVVDFAHTQGAKMAIQLNHAGRKASSVPALPDQPHYPTNTVPVNEGGWETVAPSPIAADGHNTPRELSTAEVRQIPKQFARAAGRAVEAGFDAVEIHGAHGYLLHQFLSPLSNERNDAYGGSFEARTRLLLEVVEAVRAAIGEDMPLILRLSATDWVDAGWSLDDTVRVSALAQERGADLIDVTSGGNVSADIPVGPNYQARFADEVRARASVPTAAVGLITEPAQAEALLVEGRCDAVLIGREALRNPSWPRDAFRALGMAGGKLGYPPSYHRAAPRDPR
ncbi:NADH:flavin oxidoreductase/NADH oxidase [Corynebacterium tapiri]|uniref:NADH:flavin oxidoreductase/NADH oxidase n=1 Tax=Corynebacterium tapiri TaxID=1448266 RepID=A0A5C4U2S7_9CORY|nr:NADH:flavin oxidoreductase/NADH oxidase [Corynebacterium tapiri]TNL96875.1 NADH:flavin oxidoreductase/NADH oxidase [Corynebacterium tapiri]